MLSAFCVDEYQVVVGKRKEEDNIEAIKPSAIDIRSRSGPKCQKPTSMILSHHTFFRHPSSLILSRLTTWSLLRQHSHRLHMDKVIFTVKESNQPGETVKVEFQPGPDSPFLQSFVVMTSRNVDDTAMT